MNFPRPPFLSLALSLALLAPIWSHADIVINEILYDAEPNTQCTEFIEIHNSGPDEVDLSGWAFTNGIDFVFPAGTTIAGGGYLVIAEDPATILAEYGSAALGPWSGGLRNEGETVELSDAAGNVIDEVDYNDAFPWPLGALNSGLSMELIHPSLDNQLGGSWRSNQPPAVQGELTYFTGGDQWSYRPGTSAPPADWNTAGFVEGAEWLLGTAPFGFGSTGQVHGTTITGMQSNYTSVYARHPFTIAAGELPQQSLRLRHNVDDGFIAYLNGVEIARVRADGASDHDDVASARQNPEGEWAEMLVPAGAAQEGTNVLAIVAYNQGVGSSDFAFDFELIRPAVDTPEPVPTPGKANSVLAPNAAPQIRQVDHSPEQPLSTEPAVITAKVTDPDGVGAVELQYQVVAPGDYIPAFLAKTHSVLLADPNGPRDENPAYNDPANWTTITMRDDGTEGDEVAGDSIYTATIPAQANRTLVRYRITVADALGESVRVPYADDPSLNFAYYVYDGVPDFVADTRSVTGQVGYVHPKEVLESLPVYALLTTQTDFTNCVAYDRNLHIPSNNYDARSAFNWSATFVYNGKVYDHIGYRLRQRNARYAGSGKRSFRFRFNDGNHIQLHDDNGDPYPTKWRTLNTHKMLGSRGGVNFGLYEAANSVLWNVTGSPAPLTHWFHLRVVKSAEEQPAGTNGQHLGDFYGLLIALEDYDVRYLETHDLERGNLYKLKTGGNDGLSVQRYQAKGAVDDASDFTNIINQLRNNKSDSWLRDHVDWNAYYKYKVVVDAVRTYDVSNGITPNNGEHLKNRSYYFRPDPATPFGKLNLMPWDSDTSWGPNWNGGWDWAKSAMNNREEFNKEYKNIVREFRDLVWQEDQINPLLDSFQDKLEAFQLADRDRWTGGTGSPNPGSQSDGPLSNRVTDMKRFAFDGGSWNGGSSANRDFIYNASGNIVANDSISRDDGLSGSEGRDAYLDALAFDPHVPDKPTITYTGAANYPTDQLSFQTTAFADPQGAGTFAAMEWRIAEISPPPGATINLLPTDANWSYLDDGSDQGQGWREPGFDDSAWQTGPAPLGYGGISGFPGGSATTEIAKVDGENNRFLTAYFRTTVAIDDPDLYQSFTIRMLADDGAIVYINGVEALRDGFDPGTIVNFDSESDDRGNEGEYDEFAVSGDLFVAGQNTIAVELHNESPGSSDLGLGFELEATPLPPAVRFEWDASWESGELTTQQTQIDIPLAATRENRLYRARVRFKDDSERWSNWSDAHEFTTSTPDIQPLLDRLVISEIMYHPAPPTAAEISAGFGDDDDFEFVEVYNASPDEPLLLTGVRFTKGIDFDFPEGTELAPGAFLLVVRNRAAFEQRYGTGLPIAGEYGLNDEGKLDNGGERIKLSFGAGTPIRDFDYDDDDPWPSAADGTGASLELIAPDAVPDHSQATSWRASATPGGSPGAAAPAGQSFAEFLASFGIADPNPELDSDQNGLSNFLEFALAGNPTQANSPARPAAGSIEVDGDHYLTITFRRPANPSGIAYVVEFSTDLAAWAGGGVRVSATPQEDNTVVEVWRSAAPIPEDGEEFARLRVSQ